MEILASSCLPVYLGIEDCPPHAMKVHPKGLYKLINAWPGLKIDWVRPNYWHTNVHIKVNNFYLNMSIPLDQSKATQSILDDGHMFDKELYLTVSAALLQYTRNVFSSTAMAQYFLSTIEKVVKKPNDGPLRMLFLTHLDSSNDIDYTTDTLLHGLRSLLNDTWVVDFPCR